MVVMWLLESVNSVECSRGSPYCPAHYSGRTVCSRMSRMDPHQVTQERLRQRYGVPTALSEFVVSTFRLSGRGVF